MSAPRFDATRRQLTALRLSALGIDTPHNASPEEVVRGGLALQGQDFSGLLWSIGLRSRAETRATVTASHEAAGFVRTWPMRGTLHAIVPGDLGWLLALTGARQIRSAEGRRRELGLSESDFVRANEITRTVLAGGAAVDRGELLAAFDAGGVSPAGQRGVHILGYLAQSGLIALIGQKHYTLLEPLSGAAPAIDKSEALRTLAVRYITSHGPATARDLAWWSGMTLTDARSGLTAASDTLTTLMLDGVEYFHTHDLEPATAGVHLLPGFDEYLLGYTDRRAQLSPEHFTKIVPGSNGMFLSTIVVDGEVVGTWRRDRKRGGVEVSLQPFGSLSAATLRRIRKALVRYSDFLEQPVTLAT